MAYRTTWEMTVTHEGLGKYRNIRGSDQNVVAMKALYQQQQWEEQWQRKLAAEHYAQLRMSAAHEREQVALKKARQKELATQEKARQKEEREQYIADRKQEATECDDTAKDLLNTLKNILNHTLDINDAVDWEQIKDRSIFGEPAPNVELPPSPQYVPLPSAPIPEIATLKPVPSAKPDPPKKEALKYQPVMGFMDKLFSSRKVRKETEAVALYHRDYDTWVSDCKSIDDQDAMAVSNWENLQKSIEAKNTAARSDWEQSVKLAQKENRDRRALWEQNCEKSRTTHAEKMKLWEHHKEAFYERQRETNAAIDQNRENYLASDPGAILDYCDTVLSNSIYPDFLPKEWDLDYTPESKILVVDYILPSPELLPTLKEVQYIQSRDEFKESHLSEKEQDALYDSLLYQVALRTIHELFEADVADALKAIAFNGIVTALNKTTGHSVTSCIMSIMAHKDAFIQINLANIEPKACFKSLKGIAAAKLTGITAVPPVMTIDKEDRRIVASYGVLENVSEGTNLATMDWEDFEHLIREVFEKEFSVNGGEVKVTQASRDGGVDAIAFDPDPIRGGKIVIQAKRYTNVVGVSAVRDLYGTVINEGATKGILVTTASYGPDAYEFSKGKPLSLLTGGNLLHLLEKHGQQAYININEARLAQNK